MVYTPFQIYLSRSGKYGESIEANMSTAMNAAAATGAANLRMQAKQDIYRWFRRLLSIQNSALL